MSSVTRVLPGPRPEHRAPTSRERHRVRRRDPHPPPGNDCDPCVTPGQPRLRRCRSTRPLRLARGHHGVVGRFVGEPDRSGQEFDLPLVERALLPDERIRCSSSPRSGTTSSSSVGSTPTRRVSRAAIPSSSATRVGRPRRRAGWAEPWPARFRGVGGSDRLGNELAEDHLHDRGDRQRDRNRHPGRHLTERSLDARLEDAGYRGFGQHTEEQ